MIFQLLSSPTDSPENLSSIMIIANEWFNCSERYLIQNQNLFFDFIDLVLKFMNSFSNSLITFFYCSTTVISFSNLIREFILKSDSVFNHPYLITASEFLVQSLEIEFDSKYEIRKKVLFDFQTWVNCLGSTKLLSEKKVQF
jgi:hypothetical protein